VTAAGVPFAAAGLYQVTLALAASRYRPFPPARGGTRLTVLVPAHDEESSIAACVRSLLDQTYPGELYEVAVVADNCTDHTAERAEAAGARVLVRDEPEVRGKGQALRWALDRVLVEAEPPDAVVVVDADTHADRGFLAALVAPLAAGAHAVQGESLLVDDGTRASTLRAAAFLLVNRVRPSGRAVLGLPSHLAGNGMLVRRETLEAHPWDAYTSAEDLEYALRLRLNRIDPVFAGGAILRSPTAPNAAAAREQQLRWEGGKIHLAKTWIPALVATAVRDRRPVLLDAAVELAVPPLGLLGAGAAAGTVAAAALVAGGAAPRRAVAPWAVAVASIPIYVLVGLRAAGAPASAYRALAGAPMLVVQKVPQLGRLLRFRGDTWVRTERG
jgi:hypothetical protein